jgi:translation initiation factor 2 alpha subunit (eIF-2alpha)
MELEEGNIVLGTVEKVTNTITFVRLPNRKQGTLISSEIAPGRIKHMRAYVVPNKKIVCKILKVSGDRIELSLRRVNSKEKKEVMQAFKQEQAIKSAFKQIFAEDAEKIEEKIKKEFSTLPEFIDTARENKKLIERYIPKDKQEAFIKITEKRKKTVDLRQIITIKCLEDDGVKRIKEIFSTDNKNVKITYISAGEFKLSLSTPDFKSGKKIMNELLESLENKAKENNCEFESKEEKK